MGGGRGGGDRVLGVWHPHHPAHQHHNLKRSLSSQIINVLSLPLVLSACLPCCSGGGKGLASRYKALELLWAFAGPQRHPCLLPSPTAIAGPMFATLAPSSATLCPSFLLSTSSKQCCCRPLNGSTSWQVTPCMNFSYGAECEWTEETASNFLISCPLPARCINKSFLLKSATEPKASCVAQSNSPSYGLSAPSKQSDEGCCL